MCILYKNDTYTYKNWCRESLQDLREKGDQFCTLYPSYNINRQAEDELLSASIIGNISKY